MTGRYVYAKCMCCYEVTACVDTHNPLNSSDGDGWNFSLGLCCGDTTSNPCITIHFSDTDPTILEDGI